MNTAITVLRLCFIVLFGTMSLLHGPVMTFSGAHAATAVDQHAAHDCHEDQAPPAKHAECNAFACFMAVEPLPIVARPLHPILFAVMAATPMTALEPLRSAPALPPPRLQG